MRRLLQNFFAVLALGLLAVPAHAQLVDVGVQGSVITAVDDVDVGATDPLSLSGTFGLGGRLSVSPPMMPVSFVGSADYYFVDCPSGAECSLWTAQAAVELGLPFPIVRPYVLGGYQYRKDEVDSNTGFVVGAGLQLNFAVSFFLEGQFELADAISAAGGETPDIGTPFVIKGGVKF